MDYQITLKARVDFSNVDPAILANAQLDVIEKIAMVYRLYSPTNQNPAGAAPGLYLPEKARVETNNNSYDGLINAAGEPTGTCYVNDNTFGAYDHIGFHYGLRSASSSPFGDLDSIQFEFRSDPGALSNVDLPTDSTAMMSAYQGSYLFLQNLRQPAGSGLDLYFGIVTDAALDIKVR